MMRVKVEDAIIGLLMNRAPNWVSELVVRAHLSEYAEEAVKAATQKLVGSNRIIEEIDERRAIGKPVRYYQLSSTAGIPVRDTIKIGDIEVPRVVSAAGAKYFPEDYNEAVERLAEYTAALEKRFAELVKEEQRKYWANIVSVFGVFMAVLAFSLVSLPKIMTDPSLPFWSVVKLNLAQVLPLAVTLALFIWVLRLVIR